MKGKVVTWIIVLSAVVVALKIVDRHPLPERIGHAVACSSRFPFTDQQAEILEYGLQNVRGLAYDEDSKRLFLAEGDRSLLVGAWNTDGGTNTRNFDMRYPDRDYMCLEQRCDDADQRGLAVLGGSLYSAEHGRGRIAARILPKSGLAMSSAVKELLAPSSLGPLTPQSLTGPTGIAAVDQTLFITDDRPWPGSATPGSSYDAADYAAWMTKGQARPFGGLYVCDVGSCVPTLIAASLRRPSGIVAAGPKGPVFVAEADAHEIRWPIFSKGDSGWSQQGSLGSIPMSGEPLPTFFGLALHDPCKGACKDPRENESRRIVFAAGPGGLYVFDNGGTILGRVMFDEPVSGLALTGKEGYGGIEGSAPTRYRLYLVVGHMLCSLIFEDRTEAPGTNTTVNPPESGPTLTQPEQPVSTVPPRPGATQGKLLKPDSPSDPSKPTPSDKGTHDAGPPTVTHKSGPTEGNPSNPQPPPVGTQGPGPTDHKPQNPMQPVSPPHNNNPRCHCAKRKLVPPNTTPTKDQSNCDCEREKSNSP